MHAPELGPTQRVLGPSIGSEFASQATADGQSTQAACGPQRAWQSASFVHDGQSIEAPQYPALPVVVIHPPA
jgi:hypothetical protein